MALTPVTLTMVGGPSTIVYWNQVTYVRSDPANAARCYLGTTTNGPDDPLHVAQSPLAVLTLLAAASGIIVGGVPLAPFAALSQVDGQSIAVQQSLVTAIADRPGIAPNCALYVGLDGPFAVSGAKAAVEALIAAAAGGSGGVPATGRFQTIAFAVIAAVDGAVVASVPTGAVTLRNPYVPASGIYEHQVDPALIPAGAVIAVSPVPGSGPRLINAVAGAPPLPNPEDFSCQFEDDAGAGVDTQFVVTVAAITT